MKTLRNMLVTLAAVLMCGVVAFDHYRINASLYHVESAAYYNNVQLADLISAQDAVSFAAVSQEVVRLQARRVVKLETQLEQHSDLLRELLGTNDRLEAAVHSAAEQIKDLVDDNSKLEAELDASSSQIERARAEVARLTEELVTRTKEIDALKLKLEEATKTDETVTPPAPEVLQ
jgi:chromosome segregation ATPase